VASVGIERRDRGDDDDVAATCNREGQRVVWLATYLIRQRLKLPTCLSQHECPQRCRYMPLTVAFRYVARQCDAPGCRYIRDLQAAI